MYVLKCLTLYLQVRLTVVPVVLVTLRSGDNCLCGNVLWEISTMSTKPGA